MSPASASCFSCFEGSSTSSMLQSQSLLAATPTKQIPTRSESHNNTFCISIGREEDKEIEFHKFLSYYCEIEFHKFLSYYCALAWREVGGRNRDRIVKGRKADMHTYRQADIHTDRQTDRTERQAGRQAGRHTDRKIALESFRTRMMKQKG
eukprot:746239-Hanusia_phi.AAC.3